MKFNCSNSEIAKASALAEEEYRRCYPKLKKLFKLYVGFFLLTLIGYFIFDKVFQIENVKPIGNVNFGRLSYFVEQLGLRGHTLGNVFFYSYVHVITLFSVAFFYCFLFQCRVLIIELLSEGAYRIEIKNKLMASYERYLKLDILSVFCLVAIYFICGTIFYSANTNHFILSEITPDIDMISFDGSLLSQAFGSLYSALCMYLFWSCLPMAMVGVAISFARLGGLFCKRK